MKKFDCIIACGDSYTEGHRNVLGIDISETWPAKLAKYFGVPYENLAEGGACNLEIALQPMLKQQKQYENPLYMFNFTIDERLLILDSLLGSDFISLFSLLPGDTQHIPFSKEYRNIINYFLVKQTPQGYDGFQAHTCRAIELAHNVKSINPNATVLWGFIHSDNHGPQHTIFDRGGLDFDNNTHVQFPMMENCYNSYVDHRPLQHFVTDEDLVIGKEDTHPNREGIEVLAKTMIEIFKKCDLMQ